MSEKNQEQVNELAKILKDLEPADWEAVKKTVDDIKGVVKLASAEDPPPEKRSRPKMVLNDRAASIVTAEGLVVTVDKMGDVTCAWGSKPLVPDHDDPRIWMPVKELKQCVQHVVSLNNSDLCKLRDSWAAQQDEKIRYYAKNGKRAFAAGLAIGRKG